MDKIFLIGKPTRKWPVFIYGTNEKHTDPVLLPKLKMDVKKITPILNDWFLVHAKELGLRKYGRWGVGVKQLENCPIDDELMSQLQSCVISVSCFY
jgi:hypothetical protein